MILKLRACAKSLLLFIAAIAVGIVLVEAVLRIAGISYIQAHISDANRGGVHRPNAKGWFNREGKAYITTNSDGLRDREHSLVKPADTFRIAVLGDSFAAAFQVTVKKTFWSVIERELNNCSSFAGKNVEVINFGVSGYGTAQELLTLRHQARKYDPDLVLLACLPGNDVRNNSKVLEPSKVRPFFIYRDGNLELDLSFRNLPQYKRGLSRFKRTLLSASSYSYILQLMYEVRQKPSTRFISLIRTLFYSEQRKGSFLAKPNKKPSSGIPEDKKTVPEQGLDMMVYREDPGPDWENAWRITEGLIILMHDEVKKMGADFLVVTLSNGIQVHPDPSVRTKFMEDNGVHNLFYPDERIWEVCTAAGIPVLTLVQPFQVYAEKNDVCLHGFSNATHCGGHWNEQGHSLAGRLISDEICRSGKVFMP
jgi:hypothetical protein